MVTWLIKSNRYIWKSFLLPKKAASAAPDESDILADYYGRSRNSFGMLGLEGGLPALIMDLMMGVVVIVLAVRSGRLKELKMKRSALLE